ncbi:MAG TPA: carbamoyltransferase C-terminal domain-containing protein [Ferruginibacter sp.]|nr:carbamoyltransferase C-terminal domain-containing protein [Ferruginibacter sp.]HRO05247.1 carbamoyltransferase C-terminal domain-containing protein [Ferruginibacter sp.]HRO96009.1 carbamoyltransferase C-terminal domain-containing protein [Ferruginibacter sp.]HRP48657.1 carbamoyltransferase C-terminal domain-containing protein [Ferruginibacter sp.]
MIIIGINAYHADSSAAIFVKGRMVAAIEEERFTRVKHWAGFPVQAINFCLKEAGVTMEQVDYFAVGRDPRAKFLKKIMYLVKNPAGSLKVVKDRFKNSLQIKSIDKELEVMSGVPESYFKSKLVMVEHHRSHLASAFFASPFREAACISIDGSGDFTTTMRAIGNDRSFNVLDSVDFPHSLGIFYSAFTQWLGFPHYGDEYKVMGMAPYGEAKYMSKLEEVIELTENGLFKLNLKYFKKGTQGIISYGENHVPVVSTLYSEYLTEMFGTARTHDQPLTQFHKDMAASIQRMTENVIFHMLNDLHRNTGLTDLCIAGGVAQNSVANGKITRNTPFRNIYIPSAGHDAGISMGAALYTQHVVAKMERQPQILSAYTGSRFSNEEIKELLTRKNIVFKEYADDVLYDKITNRLIDGGVVGWMTGRSEFGPRALGGRSIIADPRRQDAKEILNLKIKRRESFRPFAPSILKEYVKDYFEIDEAVPFMERVFPIKIEKRAEIPAVTHVDGSGRLQTVDAAISPRYYALIDTFRKRTGVPILLNTSFNENEPIVNTPEEALACYTRTNMDMLVMENIVVER